MLRALSSLIVVAGILCATLGCAGKAKDDAAEIKRVFSAYREALLANDGKTAVELVDRKTLDYYGKMRRLAWIR